MKTLEVVLSDEVATRVEQIARDRGVSVHDVLAASVLEKLERDTEFGAAAEYVLSKNRELYERLA